MRNKDRQKEQRFIDETARAYITALIQAAASQGKEPSADFTATGYQMARETLKARQADKMAQYISVIEGNTPPLETLKKLLAMDGNSGWVLDFLIDTYYADKNDPLRAYAGNFRDGETRTGGQIALAGYYKTNNLPPVERQVIDAKITTGYAGGPNPPRLAGELKKIIEARETRTAAGAETAQAPAAEAIP